MCHISGTTVANILKDHGIQPAPEKERTPSWATFLKAHWETIFATDFTTVEVWTPRGIVRIYILVVMHLKTRQVHIVGLTLSPNTAWITQVCRNLTDQEDGFQYGASHLILDRDTAILPMREYIQNNTETEVVLLPPKSPNLNAYMERWFRSLKSECLDRMIFFGERSLERAFSNFVEHYHSESNHQGLGNNVIESVESDRAQAGHIRCRERLGRLLKYYHRNAA